MINVVCCPSCLFFVVHHLTVEAEKKSPKLGIIRVGKLTGTYKMASLLSFFKIRRFVPREGISAFFFQSQYLLTTSLLQIKARPVPSRGSFS